MDGEPKKEMYELLPDHLYPATFNILPGIAFDMVKQNLHLKPITFPCIVKPEVGCQGILFRKIDSETELATTMHKCRLNTWCRS